MRVARFFLTGFLTLAVLHLLVTCSEDDSSVNPDPHPKVNVEEIHQSAQRVEDAFRGAVIESVLEVLTDEAQAQYGDDLEEIRPPCAQSQYRCEDLGVGSSGQSLDLGAGKEVYELQTRSLAAASSIIISTLFPRKSFPRHWRLRAYPRSDSGVQPYVRADSSTPEVHVLSPIG
ncbi:MAG: hypothetical protein KFH87_05650 [Bacteroidetes bacterium]|nr:hypothetical protein [Bacteroidota bacterium]